MKGSEIRRLKHITPYPGPSPKHAPEEGAEEKKHRKTSRKTLQKRRLAYYGKGGRGSIGLIVRSSRVMRRVRRARRIHQERMQSITGQEPSESRLSVSKGFVVKLTCAMDALLDELIRMAAEFAKKRQTGSKKTGLRIRKEDIESAIFWFHRLSVGK